MFKRIFGRLLGPEKKIRVTLEFEGDACDRFLSLVDSVGSSPREVMTGSLQLYEYIVQKYFDGTKFFEREPGGDLAPLEFFGEETENFKKKIVCIADKKIENGVN